MKQWIAERLASHFELISSEGGADLVTGVNGVNSTVNAR